MEEWIELLHKNGVEVPASLAVKKEWGYDFDLVLSWLESLSEHENDLAEEHPKYAARAAKLESIITRMQADVLSITM